MTRPLGRRGERLVAWVVVLLGLLAVLALLAVGANRPPDPHLAGLAGLAGFGEVAFAVTPAPGSGLPTTTEFCALLADDEASRARGMTGRSDLAGYDAMVFRFPEDTTGSFYMRNVPVPLSIAWFDAAGRFAGSAEMAPCGDRGDCPTYSPGRPYRLAVEVTAGGLRRLGIGEGSVLAVDGDCGPR